MKEIYKERSDAEIENLEVLLESLAESWLDLYEKSIFNGKTLNQLLTGKNGGDYYVR